MVAIEVDRDQQLAVDVELGLVPGAVADANGAGAPPTGQVRQRSFGQVPLTANAVHDLHGSIDVVVATGSLGQEGEKLPRLFGASADVEGFER
jgi:hypothetical protein